MQVSFALFTIFALAAGAYRYSVASMHRTNLNEQQSVWLCKQPQTEQSSRLSIIKTANATKGEYFEVELLIQPGAPGFLSGKPGSPPMHLHKVAAETYSVHAGTAVVSIDGQETTLEAGSSVTIPPGTPHTFANPSHKSDLVLRITVSPPGPLAEHEYEVIAGLSVDYGSVNLINPLQIFRLYHEAGMQLMDVLPAPLYKLAERVFVPVARALGYQALYPEYRMKPVA